MHALSVVTLLAPPPLSLFYFDSGQWLSYHNVLHLDLKFDNILVNQRRTRGLWLVPFVDGFVKDPPPFLSLVVQVGDGLPGSGRSHRLVICDFGCAQFCDDAWCVLCCVVLYCAVLCCAVLCCAVLCCAVLCCAVLGGCACLCVCVVSNALVLIQCALG